MGLYKILQDIMKKFLPFICVIVLAWGLTSSCFSQGLYDPNIDTYTIINFNSEKMQMLNHIIHQNNVMNAKLDEIMLRLDTLDMGFDPNRYVVQTDYRAPNMFVGSDTTGRQLIFNFQYQGYGYNIIVSDTVTGDSLQMPFMFTEGYYNIWIESDHWWLHKYLQEDERELLLALELEFVRATNEHQKQGQFWNMFMIIKKAVTRARLDMVTGQSQLDRIITSWYNYE